MIPTEARRLVEYAKRIGWITMLPRRTEPAPKGWLWYHEWQTKEAARLGLSKSAIRMRFVRGLYPNLEVKKISPRLVIVKE